MIEALGVRLAARLHDASSGASPGAVVKRLNSNSPWPFVIFFIIFLLCLPFLIYLSYTIGTVFPVLAIVTGQPKYESVPLEARDDAVGNGDDDDASKWQSPDAEVGGEPRSPPPTMTIRGLHRALYSISGVSSLLHALPTYIAVGSIRAVIYMALSSLRFLPGIVQEIIVSLLTLQLQTVCVHTVMTPPSSRMFWSRVPPFRRNLTATALPSLVLLVAVYLSVVVPLLLSGIWDTAALASTLSEISDAPQLLQSLPSAARVIGCCLLAIVSLAVFCIPAQAVLIRIQASLLPAPYQTIVPFDRSFGVSTAAADGVLSMREAWSSLAGSWRRLYLTYLQLFGLIVAGELAISLVAGLTVLLVSLIGNIV
ncbi:hypothetical protein BX600DRAFT_435875 [Xylariales sp. PMI_506]|nr:hypothetical protein BX600DRAFT_435875 [Xylariales sp. PMI_506]